MIKKATLILTLILLVSCKGDNKTEANKDNKTEDLKVEQTSIEEPVKNEPKLPPNTIQINKEPIEFSDIDLTISSIQSLDKGNNEYLLKIFIKDDSFEKYSNGDYSFFIQLFPMEGEAQFLEEKYKAKKHIPLSVSLKNVKKYKDDYVLFKGVNSQISLFDKMIFGIYDSKNKQDVFRTQINDALLKN